jgi:glycerophosphoryl diester phosphodiesterase
MFRNRYLAHALGGLDGYSYLNNEPALVNSLANEHKYLEVDLTLTTDGHVVPAHGWSEKNAERCGMKYDPSFRNMTKELFLKQTLHDMPTMDTETLYGYMKKYPDLFWQLDLHTLNYEKAVLVTRAVLADFHDDTELFSHFLIQANSPEMFEGIESVYHFTYYQLFLKKGISDEDLEECLRYCTDNGLVSVSLNSQDADPETIRKIHDAGLAVVVYTVDKKKRRDELFDMGADTICTDVFSPRQDKVDRFNSLPPVRLYNRIVKKIKRLHK